jgi:hypothetical protein
MRLVILAFALTFLAAPGAIAQQLESEPQTANPLFVQVSLNHHDFVYYDGDLLGVTIQANVEVFVYCVYHQANGDAMLLFPNRAARRNRVKAGTQIQPLAGNVRIRAPFGSERLQVISALRPLAEFDRLLDPPATGDPIRRTELVERWCEKFVRSGVNFQKNEFTLDVRPSR